MTSSASPPAVPWWKWALAACGAATIVAAIAAGAAYAVSQHNAASRRSELTLHPERQNEILAARRAETLAERLGLDPQQTGQLSALMARMREERIAAREQHAGDLWGMVQARRSAMAGFEAELRGILKPEQMPAFDELKQDLFGRVQALQGMRGLLGGGVLPELPPGALAPLPANPAATAQP